MKSVHVRDELHRQLKSIAAERGETLISVLEQLVETGLKDYRDRRRGNRMTYPFKRGEFTSSNSLFLTSRVRPSPSSP